MATATLSLDRVHDWASFHRESARAFGFPDYYGGNNNAWIDCLSYMDDGDASSRFELGPVEQLVVQAEGFNEFRRRCPEIASALPGLVAAVNERYSFARLVVVTGDAA